MKILIILLFTLFGATACTHEKQLVPVALQQKLKSLYPEAREIEWKQEQDNFEANFEVGDVEMSIILDAQGHVIEKETEIKKEDLPKMVKAALRKELSGYEVQEADKIEKKKGTIFEVQLKKGDSTLVAMYRPDGTLIETVNKSAEKEEIEANNQENWKEAQTWQRDFKVDKSALTSIGENPYFILKPGYRLILRGTEDGKQMGLAVTVLNEVKVVDGVETRIVEERETQNGSLSEVSRNFYAIDPKTRDVFYFGESVDIYRNGKVVGHEGAWLSGEDGAHFGLMMPGQPHPGQKFYQEVAPGKALDRAEVKSLNETLDTPAGHFTHCLKTEETTLLEPGIKEYKMYAPGVGLVLDGGLKLVQFGLKHSN